MERKAMPLVFLSLLIIGVFSGCSANQGAEITEQAAVVEEDHAMENEENRIESRNGIHMLENAETIGLGSRKYRLVDIRK